MPSVLRVRPDKVPQDSWYIYDAVDPNDDALPDPEQNTHNVRLPVRIYALKHSRLGGNMSAVGQILGWRDEKKKLLAHTDIIPIIECSPVDLPQLCRGHRKSVRKL